MQKMELDEIQNVILSGYSHQPVSSYLFLQMPTLQAARDWLTQITPNITMATPWPKDANGKVQPPATCLNIAFTHEGLEMLKIGLDGFQTEFCEGMAGPVDTQDPTKLVNRARRLGDTGDSQPTNWEFGGPMGDTIHCLLLLFATNTDTLTTLRDQQLALLQQHEIKVVTIQAAYRPIHSREPFGFMDGFSQPAVEGSVEGDTTADHQPIIKTGEFLLGYRNEYNLFAPAPTQPALARNGSYLVYRKMEQDVVGFWNFVYAMSGQDGVKAEKLAAKMVGRWRSGAPLTIAPDQDDQILAADLDKSNDFTFADTDLAGYSCPVGSHIRRVNPRDALQPDPAASLVDVNRHRILRRGRAYGPEYPQDVVQHLLQVAQAQGANQFVSDGEGSRGLAQIIINADIKRQFEFIQQSWVNDPKFDGSYDTRDPLIGNNGEDKNKADNMTIARHPVRQVIQNVPRFVKILGGGYFFLPSRSGLRFIAGQQ